MRAIRQESDSEPEGQDPLSPVECQEMSQLVEDQDPALSETGAQRFLNLLKMWALNFLKLSGHGFLN